MDDVVAEKKAVQMPPITTPLTRTPKNKKKKNNNRALWNYLFNLAACCLITFSLLGIDFVLFAASGPVNVFAGSGLRSEVFYMLAGMGAAIVLVYFIFSFLSIIIYLLTALTTGLFTYSMVHQFANFNAGTGGGSETFGAVVAGVVVFCILMFTPKRFKALLVMVAVFCFGAVLVNQNRPASEFLIEPDMPATLAAAEEEGEKTVTLMIANAPSYSYLASLEKTDAAEMYKNFFQGTVASDEIRKNIHKRDLTDHTRQKEKHLIKIRKRHSFHHKKRNHQAKRHTDEYARCIYQKGIQHGFPKHPARSSRYIQKYFLEIG